jgi:hypothetical protein
VPVCLQGDEIRLGDNFHQGTSLNSSVADAIVSADYTVKAFSSSRPHYMVAFKASSHEGHNLITFGGACSGLECRIKIASPRLSLVGIELLS